MRKHAPIDKRGCQLLLVARFVDRVKDNDSVWSRIDDLRQAFQEQGVNLLYISKRQEFQDTSIIASAQSVDIFKQALHEIIGIQIDDRTSTVFPLVRMKMFDIPKNIGKEASRYLITIKTKLSDVEKVYQTLSEFRPSADIAFTYLAFIKEPPCDTLTLSAFAKSYEHLQRFVKQELMGIPGIVSITITAISKTKRLTSYSEMVDVLRRELGELRIDRPLLDLSDLSQ
jgi:hypothetical protein